MSDNTKNTDKSVKDLFENFESQPSEHVWENIKTTIHVMRIAKMKRNIAIATPVAMAIVASVIAIVMSNLSDKQIHTTTISEDKIAATYNDEYTQNNISDNETTTLNVTTTVMVEDHHIRDIQQKQETTANYTKQQTDNNNISPCNLQPVETNNDTSPAMVNESLDSNNIHADESANKTSFQSENNDINSVSDKDTEPVETNSTKKGNIDKTSNNEISVVENNSVVDKNDTIEHNNNDEDKKGVIYVPTAFTPDRAENNRFFVKGKNIKDYEIRIMTKSKVLVYSSTDINEQWDGTHNGESLGMGVYIYMIVFTDFNNEVHQKNGTLTLIRQK